LDGLSRLDKLVLDRNKIKGTDAASFVGTVRLRELRMEENSLRSLAHLGALKVLRHLYLGANRIAELVELDRLGGLTALTKLSLANNQVGS
jgi:Leucine-rich repeat (LRR) protein